MRVEKISCSGPVDIRPELHTPECNELVKALLKCYEENRFGYVSLLLLIQRLAVFDLLSKREYRLISTTILRKIFGACDKHNVAMEKCFHKEQEERRLNNSKRTRKKDAKADI